MLLDVGIVVLSLYGYIAQLLLLRKQTHIGTFSILITAVIILSSLLKIFFYFLNPYALNLLIQNILLLILHLFIVRQCIRLSHYTHSLNSLFSAFWKWKNLAQYIYFIAGLSLLLAAITVSALHWQLELIGEAIGLAATAIEIMLGVPQIVSSWKSKSVAGLSLTMIAIWVFCDGLKTYYFITNDQPFQFILTGAIQIVLDFVILAQIALYHTPTKTD